MPMAVSDMSLFERPSVSEIKLDQACKTMTDMANRVMVNP